MTSLFVVAIVGCLVVLAFLPEIIRKKTFDLRIDTATSLVPKSFDLDRTFRAVHWEGTKLQEQADVSLRRLLGSSHRSLLINFWATWCPPCVEEFPSLEYLNRQLKGNGQIRVITVSVDERSADIATFFETLDFKPTVIVLLDKEGTFSREVGTTKFPETYLVDSEGKLLHKWIGPQDWLSADIIRKLAKL